MSDLVERLKSASVGEAVWRVLTPDGKLYIDVTDDGSGTSGTVLCELPVVS